MEKVSDWDLQGCNFFYFYNLRYNSQSYTFLMTDSLICSLYGLFSVLLGYIIKSGSINELHTSLKYFQLKDWIYFQCSNILVGHLSTGGIFLELLSHSSCSGNSCSSYWLYIKTLSSWSFLGPSMLLLGQLVLLQCSLPTLGCCGLICIDIALSCCFSTMLVWGLLREAEGLLRLQSGLRHTSPLNLSPSAPYPESLLVLENGRIQGHLGSIPFAYHLALS